LVVLKWGLKWELPTSTKKRLNLRTIDQVTMDGEEEGQKLEGDQTGLESSALNSLIGEGEKNMEDDEEMDNNESKDSMLSFEDPQSPSLVSYDEFDLRFDNIKGSMVDTGFCKMITTFIKWKKNYVNEGIPEDEELLNKELPVETPHFPVDPSKITYTWIGHSTAVISFGEDANILIDPVFSERASPFQWLGPKRFRPVPCQISQLPRIDAVLVSHDHYDHLDEAALTALHKRFPECQFFAGLRS
jgi:hypothetical protein